MKSLSALPPAQLRKILGHSSRLPLATKNYPSRGQTAVQTLYQTAYGKVFLKHVSRQNHLDCQINPTHGSLAEREFWAYRLAVQMGLPVPELILLDNATTLQRWLDLPDARTYATNQGILTLEGNNVFDCALFDWFSGQIDRHDANYLYDYARQKIILIDSAHCFLPYTGSIPDYLKYFEIGFASQLIRKRSTPISRKLRHLPPALVRSLVPLRDAASIEALLARLDQMKQVTTIGDIIRLYRGHHDNSPIG